VSTYSIVAQYDASSEAYTYTNNAFFPLDGQGYGNDNNGHNFGFCFELHTEFTYQTGQVFSFAGDDDVWVFINDELAIDLGGTHVISSASVDLDTLGLTVGTTYDLDGFFCERHVVASDLIFSTSIVLNPCGATDTDDDGIPDLCDNCPSGDLQVEVSVTDASSLNVPVTVTYTGVYAGSSYVLTLDFGDGSKPITQPAAPTSTAAHVYGKSGTYDITATITGGGKGCSDETASGSVTINNRIAPSCCSYNTNPLKRR
jgi:fibro-slime domain-containing protein